MGSIGMCHCEGYVFQAVYSRIGYINQSVWVQNRVSLFRKVISWLKILSRPEGNRELPLKHIKKSNRQVKIYATQLVLAKLCSSFWKTATLGQGGFGEFILVQGSKIQLNQLQHRLRVPGSQHHIPTQKFLKYPGPPGFEEANKSDKMRHTLYIFAQASQSSVPLMCFVFRSSCLPVVL